MATAALPSGPDPSEQPRLLNLSTILAEWEVDAVAAHDAHLGGQPRGPHIPFANLATILGGAWPGVDRIT